MFVYLWEKSEWRSTWMMEQSFWKRERVWDPVYRWRVLSSKGWGLVYPWEGEKGRGRERPGGQKDEDIFFCLLVFPQGNKKQDKKLRVRKGKFEEKGESTESWSQEWEPTDYERVKGIAWRLRFAVLHPKGDELTGLCLLLKSHSSA